ncbi:MAG: ribonuclease P protein component 1 [Halobacteriota archaeon]|nr:ribonuclease P protein component 1 [Halobacteriota archaeon]
MEITPKNLIYHELIGLSLSVHTSTNKSLIGLAGKVVDETRNMLIIETGKGEKKVPKSCSTFKFTLPTGTDVKVDGKLLVMRPEDRVRKKIM